MLEHYTNKTMAQCPICGSNGITRFITRNKVPVHQNLIMSDYVSALSIERGDLHLVVCENCGFFFNQTFDQSKLMYGNCYDNTQLSSPLFRTYISRLIDYLLFKRKIQNSHIVEIGCGAGFFLKKLVEDEELGNMGYGFDPSYRGPEKDLNGRLTFKKFYYTSECADISADVVICRHVIEHISDPIGLLYTVRQTLVNSSHPQVFFETPCVEWILRNQVIWDFFYEHCSYFSASSLKTAFEIAGFQVTNIYHVFNGQYLWLEATISEKKLDILQNFSDISQLACQFAAVEQNIIKHWKTTIQSLAERGKVAIWGVGAKGVTLANLVDPEQRWIDCMIDLNPYKQGHYVPGTGHIILSYQEAARRGVTTAILVNPNYRDENMALLREADIVMTLLTE